MMNMLMLVIALILPLIPGLFILKCFSFRDVSLLFRLIVSFLAGHSVFSLALFIAVLCGLPFAWWSGLIVLVLLTAGTWAFSRKFRGEIQKTDSNLESQKPGKLQITLSAVLILVILLLVCQVLYISMSEGVSDRAGRAVWGLKAKALFNEQRLPACLDRKDAVSWVQPGYPLYYPFLISWIYTLMGEVDDYMIKALPPLLGLLFIFLVYAICRMENAGPAASLLAVLFAGANNTFLLCSRFLYADHLLALYVLAGTYLVFRYFRDRNKRGNLYAGFLLLAGGAWLKNEGLLFFIGAGILVLLLKRKSDWNRKAFLSETAGILIPALLFIIPFQVFRHIKGYPNADFSFALLFERPFSETLKVLSEIVKSFARLAFTDLKSTGGAWMILIPVLVLCFGTFFRKREYLFTVMFILGISICFAGAFLFSVRRLDWHLKAVPRIMQIPLYISLVFSVSACHVTKKQAEQISPEKGV